MVNVSSRTRAMVRIGASVRLDLVIALGLG
jgi:hypothetical protein